MFQRSLLYLGAIFYLANGLAMLAGPQSWFGTTPGVSATGGYNFHFIVDIGFAFLVSGGLVGFGVWARQRALVAAGLAWPVLHALFHLIALAIHGAASPAIWATELGGVIAPAAILTGLAVRAPLDGLGAGMGGLVHNALRKFERQWTYDATYQHRLVDLAPDAVPFLAALQRLGGLQTGTPRPLLHGASLAAALHEDCGPCAQITIDRILADGADPDRLRALVRRDFDAADAVSVQGFRYVEAVLAGDPAAVEQCEVLLDRFGESGLAALSLAVVVSRTYPTLKKLMGYGAACQTLDVAGQSETVVAT
ncbi:hypothetical protein [Maricaulis sp.]|uniref:hypothetical protein n=1 Tax=Maricaulis sp. TaxID=1486257 RepID=UPI00260FA991|nr:hypothetical protein [Maricaulis sp.]